MMELAAIIVETRPLPNLIKIIEDHLAMLPTRTRLYVVGGHAVEQMLIDADIPCNFIMKNGIINESDYNKLLTSIEFWNLIEEENCLIFQHDSRLLRKGIEEFYKWGYVGAPWKFSQHGGNGGLSFRHKTAMIEIIKAIKYNQSVHGNEDVYFSNYIRQYDVACFRCVDDDFPGAVPIPLRIAPREVCSKFSCETIFQLGTLGCHAIEKYLSKSEVEQILNQYK